MFSQLQDITRETRMVLYACIFSDHLPTSGYMLRKGDSHDFRAVGQSPHVHAGE
jgi:hypothetical protein